MPSVGPIGDAPRGPLQEVSMAEPEEVGPAVLASAMWALHMLFEGEFCHSYSQDSFFLFLSSQKNER